MSKDLTQRPNGSLEDKVDRLIIGFHSIESRLESLEIKVDQRLRDTQPIWETVQAQLAEIRESQQSLAESQQSLVESQQSLVESQQILVESHQRLVESQQKLVEDMHVLRAEVASLRADTEKGFRTIDRRMERQIGEFERLHAYQRDLEDRIDKIEKLTTP